MTRAVLPSGWPPHVRCVQPGIGPAAQLALFVRRIRRWLRRSLAPQRLAAARAALRGECADCPHDVVEAADLRWVRNVCGLRPPDGREPVLFADGLGLVRLARPELLLAALVSAAAGGVASIWSWWLLPVALLPLAFTVWFFRDPERCPPADPDAVLAAADGVLDDVRREAACPFFAGPAVRLGVFLSLFDVHVNRAPVAGEAIGFDYRPGARRATYRIGKTDANEQLLTWLRTDDGLPVVVRQIAGPAAQRICCVLRTGERVAAGQRFGLIKFGSRTEVFVPDVPGLQLVARPGQRVRAGETILARLPGVANAAAGATS
ncbi:MAG: phosphatidylserine decarboxylase [Planctomycetes bacterium]|nr:phosphatidylserine decarboxylase [Planctomycetota bacterium]